MERCVRPRGPRRERTDNILRLRQVEGDGEVIVPEGMYLSWGYWTEEVYVEPEPAEMYINEDGIDCSTASLFEGRDGRRVGLIAHQM